jgi:phosphoribosyl 1,2-cyclic phosphodiesterase
MMNLKFWGVRGSIPVPERGFLKYGGNTSCIEISTDEGKLLIFDCGTGLRNLGKVLIEGSKEGRIEAHILLSHLHWDHTQGLPFFSPLYGKDNSFTFYGRKYKNSKFSDKVQFQMSDIYFPVPMNKLPSHINFVEIESESIYIGNTRIDTRLLRHPGGVLGFRIEYKGKLITYATDNEPRKGHVDQNLLYLAGNTDILIFDSQYTPEEYESGKRGWGHSTWLEAVKVSKQAGVKKLILFHHDPNHNDKFVDDIVERARGHFENTIGAKEGMELIL